MTIQWGAAVGPNNQFRIGIEFSQSPATPSAGTVSVVVTAKLYLQSRYTAFQSSGADWSMSGHIADSGSTAFSNTASGEWSNSNIALLATRTRTVTLSYTTTATTTVNASVSGVVAVPGTATVTASWTTGKRPVSAPAAPSGVNWARTSDTQHTVTWTNTSPTSAAAPYQNLQVERQTNDGAWARIATVGVVSSYTDKGTVANKKYRYRVRATNTSGSQASAYTYSGNFATTPAAPSNVTATKNAAGGIAINWTDNSVYNTGFEIWHAADGVWDATPLATVANDVAKPWVHASPSAAVTHTYRLKATTTTPALASAYSAPSGVVALVAPPNAPTPLSPVSTAVDANNTIPFSWRHNPVDTTAQRQYEFQHRINGGAWVSSGVVASSNQSGVIPGGTLSNGSTLEWQVRTWGDHATASPWSTISLVTLSSAPTVLVNSPDGISPYASSSVTVAWGYSDAESNPQARWKATLYNAAGDPIETRSGPGTASATTFQAAVSDGLSYTVGVSAQDSTGVWSPEDTSTFTVAFAKPARPDVTLEWIADAAAVAVQVHNPPPAVRTNRIINPSGETGTTGWASGGGRLDITNPDDPDALAGSKVLRFTANVDAAADTAYGYFTVTGLTPGEPGAFSARVRPDALAGGTYRAQIVWLDPASATISTVNGPDVSIGGSTWGQVAVTSTVPAGADRARLAIYRREATATVRAFDVDAAMYETSATVGSYIEGTVSEADTVSVQVWRSVNGADWTLIADGLDLESSTTDFIPGLGVVNYYKAVAFSALPSSSESLVEEIVTDQANAVWVNAGPGFSQSVRLASNVKLDKGASRAKTMRRAAGREFPLEVAGQQRTRTLSLTARLWDPEHPRAALSSTWDEIEELSDMIAPACLRSPKGDRVFVSLGDPNVSDSLELVRALSWSFERVDYREPTGGAFA